MRVNFLKFASFTLLFFFISVSSFSQIIEVDPSEVPTEILQEIEETATDDTEPTIQVTPTGEQVIPSETEQIDETQSDGDETNENQNEEDQEADEVIQEEIDPEKIDLRDPPTIYGHQFFRNNNIQSYNNSANVKAPDELCVRHG